MEVEQEDAAAALEGEQLIALVLAQAVGHAGAHHVVVLDQLNHGLVEVAQQLVAQEAVVREAPLAAGILEAPAVALAREVDPLRMAELVAHEVEVALAARADGHQADHLVQRDGTVHDHVLARAVHAGVHFLVRQAEHDGLVAHQRLVVGLRVADDLLLIAAGDQFPVHLADLPVAVLLLLDRLDEEVRQAHGQAVVKADAAVLDGQAHARHGAHVLRDGDGALLVAVNQVAGQHEVGHRVHIGVHGEVLRVAGEGGAQTVIVIEHAGHAVKAEAVEMILVHPELDVGEQEVQNARAAVVKALAAPGRMIALAARMEELVHRAVKAVDALGGVLNRMGMHQIQQHGQAKAVRLVDERLELVRRAVPGGRGEEVAHLIAEARVIRMLHDGHQLHGVVAVRLDARQDVRHELQIGAHALLFRRHTDVGFIDDGRDVLRGPELFVRPRKRLARAPDHGVEAVGLLVLLDVAGIERNTVLGHAVLMGHSHLVAGEMLDGVRALDLNLPVAVAHGRHGMRRAVPAVEIADQVHLLGSRRPLTVHPAALDLVQTVIQITAGEIGQRLPLAKQLLLFGFIPSDAVIDIAFISLKAGVELENLQLLRSLLRLSGHKMDTSSQYNFDNLIVLHFTCVFNSFLY